VSIEPRGDFYGHGGPSNAPGSYFKRSALTTAQRDEIRQRYADGETATSLALEFGVTAVLIRSLVPRRAP
jgi:hypothetical protein